MAERWLPTPEDVLTIHYELVEMFARGADPIVPAGARDINLLASACTRPSTSLAGIDKYQTLEQKAAALLHSLIQNHPFHNGNKRTALVATITTLARNDRYFTSDVSDDDIFETVTALADHAFPPPRDSSRGADQVVEALAQWLRSRVAARRSDPSTQRTTDFLKRCQSAGAEIKESGASYVISNGRRSVRIGRDSRELTGQVIKSYLRKLGLSERDTGVPLEEFEQGLTGEQHEIRRFRTVLQRLAQA
jgi:death on curing protein